MIVRDLLGRLNRVQRSLAFKIAASVLVLVALVGVNLTYVVGQAAQEPSATETAGASAEEESAEPGARSDQDGPGTTTADSEAARDLREWQARMETAEALRAKAMSQLGALRYDATDVLVATGLGGLIALGVIWIGQGLTTLGVMMVIGLVVLPLRWLGSTPVPVLGVRCRDVGSFIGAAAILTLSFSVLIELVRLAFSLPWGPLAIARNVVNEAVRQKLSLVFIVMLIVALAALPGLLNESTPLRYRVQSFLQYGTGGMFWIIALLIVTMSVASVAFEQRDRIIWQTMTKPVAAWQYLLGKWLGVMGLGAVLLSVCGSGVFLFTEYLKDQKAIGEIAPYVPENGAPGTMTEDRYILFNQVLAASVSRRVSIRDFDPAVVDQGVGEMMDRAKENSPEIRDDEETRARMREQLLTELRDSYLAIEPGTDEMYYFTGLEEAKENARWLTLRYRVNVGSNDPRSLHWLTFWFPNYLPEYFQVPPGQTMSLNISPGAIQEEGILPFRVVNGRVLSDRVVTPAGAQTMSFPPDGLELRYSVGSYRMNFLRVMLILWFKLGFLAMLGIAAATCLSFPVASMVSFGTFLLAESSRFLLSSLESYQVEDNKGNILYFNKVIELVTTPLAKSFSFYSNLRPTANLVDGTLVAWGQVATGAIYMGVFTLLLYAAGVVIFRNRELATYSGH